MAIKDTLLPEFDHEMAGTRKSLERVPDAKLSWAPHPKSWPLAGLATHLSQIPQWGAMTIKLDQLDIQPPGSPPHRLEPKKSRAELLAAFDQNVAEARAALAGASDEVLLAKWSLLKGGKVVMSWPRVTALRSFVMNHNVHHRAQLGVYLRLLDVPVPALYGPSADEGTL